MRSRKQEEIEKGVASCARHVTAVKILTSCPSCLFGLTTPTTPAGGRRPASRIEIARKLLGEDWMPDYVKRPTRAGSSAYCCGDRLWCTTSVAHGPLVVPQPVGLVRHGAGCFRPAGHRGLFFDQPVVATLASASPAEDSTASTASPAAVRASLASRGVHRRRSSSLRGRPGA